MMSSLYAWRERTRRGDIRACGAHPRTSNTDTKLLIYGAISKGPSFGTGRGRFRPTPPPGASLDRTAISTMNSKASFVPFYACGARTAASAPATSPAGELACVKPERGVSVARRCWPRRPGCQRDSSASTPLDSSPPAKDLAVQVSVCQLAGMRTASDLVVQSLLVPVVGKRKLASTD